MPIKPFCLTGGLLLLFGTPPAETWAQTASHPQVETQSQSQSESQSQPQSPSQSQIQTHGTSGQADEPMPQGMWARGDGKARVRISACGADICAVNQWIRPGVTNEKVGDRLVMTVKRIRPGHWEGKAYDPQRKLTFRLSMDIDTRTMTTRGCVLGGLFCTQMGWTRIDAA